MRNFKNYILLLALVFPLAFKAQFYYGLQNEFGKSRVQYQPFYWTYYNFPRYQVYFYEGCRDIAKYVSYRMDYHLRDLEKKLDYQTDEKLQVLVYSTMGDFRQTNLGLSTDETSNTGGTTKIVGSKLSVYFNGNHADLDKQIRAGIAEVLVNEIMYGGRARDVIKNSTLLVVPDWFKYGLIAYLAGGWDTDVDNIVNDGIANDRYFKLNKLQPKEAVAVGRALWHYIADTYGESSISNILYMVKVSRSIDNAFLFVIGNNTEGLLYEWIDHLARNNMNRDTSQYFPKTPPVIKKPKTYRDYYQLKVSPDGKSIIYCRNEMTQHRIYLQDIETGKKKRIAKYGPKIDRINDLSYPLLAWHPGGQVFSIIHERKGVIYLTTYNLEDKDKFEKPITGIEKVKDFAYSPDGKKLAMSAVKKASGQSDIFVYQVNAGGLEQITNDIWDDEEPRFINKGNQIAFSSNRMQDTLRTDENGAFEMPQSKFRDIFLFDYKTKSKILYRVTDTRDINETQPSDFYSGYFTYLSDQNGIKNRFAAKLDSTIAYVDTSEHYRYVFNAHPVTNFRVSLLEQEMSLKANKVAEVFYINGVEYMYVSPISKEDVNKNYSLRNTYYRRTQLYAPKNRQAANFQNSQNNQVVLNNNSSPANDKVDINNYNFSNTTQNNNVVQKSTVPSSVTNIIAGNGTKPVSDFKFPIQQNYYVNFAMDNVVAQLDNSFLPLTYQYFTGYYNNPGINVFTKFAASDLFEDYRITGGFRVNFNNNEFFVSVENRKKLWDKQLILHRLMLPFTDNVSIPNYSYQVKQVTNDAQYRLRYPINEVSSVRGTFSYRNDRFVILAQDDPTLQAKNTFANWAGVKLEYIFDNTRYKGLNLYNGWRLKVFGEYYRGFYGDTLLKRHDLITFGFDVRHYLKIYRNLIWANRLAGSGSLGTDRLCYYLGGIDGWIGPRFNGNEQIKHPEVYTFQTIATNMRGFIQNARNGNNFTVLNSELRWPVFSFFANHPIRSDFLNNFQIIPFTDVGMCWYGANPFSKENTTNQYTFYQNPVTVTINEPKQPIIVGYGFGLRSRIFGYFVRVDFSWGIDNYTRQNRVTYFSLTTDF